MEILAQSLALKHRLDTVFSVDVNIYSLRQVPFSQLGLIYKDPVKRWFPRLDRYLNDVFLCVFAISLFLAVDNMREQSDSQTV